MQSVNCLGVMHISFPPPVFCHVSIPAVRPIVQPERDPAVLCSDHVSRGHDARQLYVNAKDSFSCAETLESKPEVLAFGSTISHGFQKQFQILKTSESVAA